WDALAGACARSLRRRAVLRGEGPLQLLDERRHGRVQGPGEVLEGDDRGHPLPPLHHAYGVPAQAGPKGERLLGQAGLLAQAADDLAEQRLEVLGHRLEGGKSHTPTDAADHRLPTIVGAEGGGSLYSAQAART